MNIFLETIAQKHLRIPTLQVRGRDRLDFHELNVGSLEQALQAAFNLGKTIGKSEGKLMKFSEIYRNAARLVIKHQLLLKERKS